MNWSVLQISPCDEERQEILSALLDEFGFDAFELSGDSLIAALPADRFPGMAGIRNRLGMLPWFDELEIAHREEAARNWNEIWENSYQPVVIAERLRIRAEFHEADPAYLDICIRPEMSFGTGHHATTAMVAELLMELDVVGKKLMDYGCGSGILAILAERLGAVEVLAIDYDPICVSSTSDNARRNGCSRIQAVQSDRPAENGKYDIVLANINKTVILNYFNELSTRLAEGGTLILSGFLKQDAETIVHDAGRHGLTARERIQQKEWTAISFS